MRETMAYAVEASRNRIPLHSADSFERSKQRRLRIARPSSPASISIASAFPSRNSARASRTLRSNSSDVGGVGSLMPLVAATHIGILLTRAAVSLIIYSLFIGRGLAVAPIGRDRLPPGQEISVSPVLPPPVSGEMVHHLVQPCLGVLGGVEFSEGEDERVLDDVSGVFHGEALLANRPPDQGQKELAVEGFELRGVRFPRDRRRLGARLPLRLRQGRPSLCLKVESLSPYCHDPEVSPAQWESLEIARQSGAGESLSCGCAPGQRPWKEGKRPSGDVSSPSICFEIPQSSSASHRKSAEGSAASKRCTWRRSSSLLQSPAAIRRDCLGVGLEVLAELAEGVRICLAAPDGLAEKSHGGKALRHHLLFLDRRQRRKNFPLGFSIPAECQE